MNILVTGAAGFVGTHLCRELRARGHRVFESDIHDADLSKPGEASRLVKATNPEYVVHLAARYGRLLCRDEPHRAVQDNAAATTELAAVCADRAIPVLYTSSSEVYGDHGEDTLTEESELRTPTTIYGLSKLWGEQALQMYMDPDSLCIVRMNMLYGPGQQAGYGRCALATFIANALRGEPFVVHRDASRSWVYISDAIDGLVGLLGGGHTGVFNLGNDRDRVPMIDLADMVRDELGGSYTVEDAPATQIRHKVYSSAKLEAATGWAPKVPLRDGVRLTAAFERQRQEAIWQSRNGTKSSVAAR